MSENTARIRELNDAFRTSFTGGKVYMTDGVAALDDATKAKVLTSVRTFTAFSRDNDPYGEHDFGSFEIDGARYFFKIDYYSARDPDLGSQDPSDPAQTERALTIMLAEEY